jgi:hypothetical protein
MSKLKDVRNDAVTRGKSVWGYVADVVESITEKNLTLAGDVSGLAISQLRLPAEAKDFSDFRARTRQTYVKVGGALKTYGQSVATILQGIPTDLGNALQAKKQPTKRAKKAATKKRPSKKAATAKKA